MRFPEALRRLTVAAGSEGNVDREHSGAPVGETGSHGAVGTDQRGQTGEVLMGSRAGLAGQGNPQAEAAGVNAEYPGQDLGKPSVVGAVGVRPCEPGVPPVARPGANGGSISVRPDTLPRWVR